MTTPCGRFDLERYVVGELHGKEAETVRNHCETCSDCGSYVAMLKDENEQFLRKHPFASFTRAHAPVVKLPWYRILSIGTLRPVLVGVGAVLLVTLTVVPVVNKHQISRGELVRFKGAPPLSFMYQREGKTAKGSLALRYREGDRIQVTCPPTRFGFVSLLSIDSRGTVSFYHPATHSNTCSVPADRNGSFVFPGSIELDATPGSELVIALFSVKQLATATVKEWISGTFDAVPDLDSLSTLLRRHEQPWGGELSTLLLRKE